MILYPLITPFAEANGGFDHVTFMDVAESVVRVTSFGGRVGAPSAV